MKEYCTLVTSDISRPWGATCNFSHRPTRMPSDPMAGQLQALMLDGWEVIDSCALPKLSTVDETPRFAFILEREIRTADRDKDGPAS